MQSPVQTCMPSKGVGCHALQNPLTAPLQYLPTAKGKSLSRSHRKRGQVETGPEIAYGDLRQPPIAPKSNTTVIAAAGIKVPSSEEL